MTQMVSRGLEHLPPALPKSVAGMARDKEGGKGNGRGPESRSGCRVLLPACCKNWSGPAEELGLPYSPLTVDPGAP
jgi:hypothetical protein